MITSKLTNRQYHNPGYEHLKSIYLLKKMQAQAPLAVASAYILPLMALQRARLAIEEYIDLTGRKTDPIWDEIDWTLTPVQERIVFLYRKIGQPLTFETGVWKDVLTLFETTGLIDRDLSEMNYLQPNEIPEKFKRIAAEFPIYRSQAVAEQAIDLLLDISDLNSPVKKIYPE